uniref:G protein-coupled receptor n=1 Tax=Pristionchus pacificus TaxID=54126 RepID=A0A8R1UZJ2_PRIPA
MKNFVQASWDTPFPEFNECKVKAATFNASQSIVKIEHVIHNSTIEALNIQLLASSGFFVGCVIFSFNLFVRPMFDFIPETTPLSVPNIDYQIPNLQNVITPISNLYVITPYRKHGRHFEFYTDRSHYFEDLFLSFRTPNDMKVYSKILLVSAFCDIICILGMMSTIAKEVIVGNACLLKLYGMCTKHSVSLCAFIFGVQEYMYTLTVCLLCLSFAFRYLAIDPDKKRRTNLLQFS